MALPRKHVIDEISKTAPKHEIVGLIEILVFIRQSRIILLQEAFSKDASVEDAKLHLTDEPWARSPSRFEIRRHEQYSR